VTRIGVKRPRDDDVFRAPDVLTIFAGAYFAIAQDLKRPAWFLPLNPDFRP
jgi:hypothetical protein